MGSFEGDGWGVGGRGPGWYVVGLSVHPGG